MGDLGFGLGLKMEEKSLGVLQLHPKFTETVFRASFLLVLLLDIVERDRERERFN